MKTFFFKSYILEKIYLNLNSSKFFIPNKREPKKLTQNIWNSCTSFDSLSKQKIHICQSEYDDTSND